MDRFAVVAEGVGAIHVDPRFAEKTPFQSTIAHGFLFVAYISEMMENNFGVSWLENGTIDMKNVGPAKPGDALLITGTIKKHEPEGESQRLTCEIVVENQNAPRRQVAHHRSHRAVWRGARRARGAGAAARRNAGRAQRRALAARADGARAIAGRSHAPGGAALSRLRG